MDQHDDHDDGISIRSAGGAAASNSTTSNSTTTSPRSSCSCMTRRKKKAKATTTATVTKNDVATIKQNRGSLIWFQELQEEWNGSPRQSPIQPLTPTNSAEQRQQQGVVQAAAVVGTRRRGGGGGRSLSNSLSSVEDDEANNNVVILQPPPFITRLHQTVGIEIETTTTTKDFATEAVAAVQTAITHSSEGEGGGSSEEEGQQERCRRGAEDDDDDLEEEDEEEEMDIIFEPMTAPQELQQQQQQFFPDNNTNSPQPSPIRRRGTPSTTPYSPYSSLTTAVSSSAFVTAVSGGSSYYANRTSMGSDDDDEKEEDESYFTTAESTFIYSVVDEDDEEGCGFESMLVTSMPSETKKKKKQQEEEEEKELEEEEDSPSAVAAAAAATAAAATASGSYYSYGNSNNRTTTTATHQSYEKEDSPFTFTTAFPPSPSSRSPPPPPFDSNYIRLQAREEDDAFTATTTKSDRDNDDEGGASSGKSPILDSPPSDEEAGMNLIGIGRTMTAPITIDEEYEAQEKLETIVESSETYFQTESKAAVRIQSLCRTYPHRSKFLRYKEAARFVQAVIRVKLQQVKYKSFRLAAISIQRNYRQYIEKSQMREIIIASERRRSMETTAAVKIQNCWRKFIAQAVFLQYRETAAAVKIQKYWWKFIGRATFLRYRESAIVIQKVVRGRQTRLEYELEKLRGERMERIEAAAAIKIQRIWRTSITRRRFFQYRASTLILQRIFRGKQQRTKYASNLLAIKTIQCQFRCLLAYRELQKLRQERVIAEYDAATKIQSLFRTAIAQKEFKKHRISCVLIQKVLRSKIQRIKYLATLNAIIHLQNRCRAFLFYQKFIRIGQEREIVESGAASSIQSIWRTAIAQTKLLEYRESSVIIQKVLRGKHQRVKYTTTLRAIIALQIHCRGYLARYELQKRREEKAAVESHAATKIQSILLKMVARSYFVHCTKSAILIQKVVRGKLKHKEYESVYSAILTTQCSYRGFISRGKLKKLRRDRKIVESAAATKIQTTWRSVTARKHYTNCLAATVQIQKIMRGKHNRVEYESVCLTIITLQCYWRGYLASCELKKLRKDRKNIEDSAIKIQRLWSTSQARMKFQRCQSAIIVIQKMFRGKLARMQPKKAHQAAITIQSQWRAYATRRKFLQAQLEYNAAATSIQNMWRVHKTVCKIQAALQGEMTQLEFPRCYVARRHGVDIWDNERLQLEDAASKIQRIWRKSMTRKKYLRSRDTAKTAARWCRLRKLQEEGHETRTTELSDDVVAFTLQATTTIQSFWRMVAARNEFLQSRGAACQIQSMVRSTIQRANYLSIRMAVDRIQCWYRRAHSLKLNELRREEQLMLSKNDSPNIDLSSGHLLEYQRVGFHSPKTDTIVWMKVPSLPSSVTPGPSHRKSIGGHQKRATSGQQELSVPSSPHATDEAASEPSSGTTAESPREDTTRAETQGRKSSVMKEVTGRTLKDKPRKRDVSPMHENQLSPQIVCELQAKLNKNRVSPSQSQDQCPSLLSLPVFSSSSNKIGQGEQPSKPEPRPAAASAMELLGMKVQKDSLKEQNPISGALSGMSITNLHHGPTKAGEPIQEIEKTETTSRVNHSIIPAERKKKKKYYRPKRKRMKYTPVDEIEKMMTGGINLTPHAGSETESEQPLLEESPPTIDTIKAVKQTKHQQNIWRQQKEQDTDLTIPAVVSDLSTSSTESLYNEKNDVAHAIGTALISEQVEEMTGIKVPCEVALTKQFVSYELSLIVCWNHFKTASQKEGFRDAVTSPTRFEADEQEIIEDNESITSAFSIIRVKVERMIRGQVPRKVAMAKKFISHELNLHNCWHQFLIIKLRLQLTKLPPPPPPQQQHQEIRKKVSVRSKRKRRKKRKYFGKTERGDPELSPIQELDEQEEQNEEAFSDKEEDDEDDYDESLLLSFTDDLRLLSVDTPREQERLEQNEERKKEAMCPPAPLLINVDSNNAVEAVEETGDAGAVNPLQHPTPTPKEANLTTTTTTTSSDLADDDEASNSSTDTPIPAPPPLSDTERSTDEDDSQQLPSVGTGSSSGNKALKSKATTSTPSTPSKTGKESSSSTFSSSVPIWQSLNCCCRYPELSDIILSSSTADAENENDDCGN